MRAALILLALALGACSLSPVHYPTLNEHPLKLGKGQLEAAGIAFVTPSTVTGQEQERQAVALTFTDAMTKARPGVKVAVRGCGFV